MGACKANMAARVAAGAHAWTGRAAGYLKSARPIGKFSYSMQLLPEKLFSRHRIEHKGNSGTGNSENEIPNTQRQSVIGSFLD